jgi:predicted amidohydrolase YtcJ
MKKAANSKNLSEPKWPVCLSGKLFFLFLPFLISCSQKQQADLIVHNAVIYTVDSAFTTAQSFAVKDGKFIAIGTDKDILAKYEAKKTIDAEEKAVYPGIIDSHCHFYGYGAGLQQVDLVGTKSYDEVLERVVTFSKEHPDAKWIIGRGWDQNDWQVKEYPDKKELDELFPTTPVLLKRIDGHAALANRKALNLAGIDSWKEIEGGTIGKIPSPYNELESSGLSGVKEGYVLSGILIDNAVEMIEKAIPKPGKEEIKASLLAAEKNCFAVGITTVDDAGLEKHIVEAIDEFQKNGELKMRVYAMLTDNKENADHYLKTGVYKTERLNVRSFKFYADGALGSRGACLMQPYSDKPEERGFLLSKPEHFDSMAHTVMLKGFQMNTHCIGDSAVKMIFNLYRANLYFYCTNNSYEESQKQNYKKNRRWRIEHFQVSNLNRTQFACYNLIGDSINPSDYNIIPSVQPTHATSDMYWAKDRLGPERVKYAYAYNDLLKAAGMIALGTDFPVENINPMYTFYAAVARKDLKGFPQGGFQMENALSRENTLRGMTIWGAYANFEEKEKGSIEIGKLADFVIMDNDIMKCEIDSVTKVKVWGTFVGGEAVYFSPLRH